METKKCKGCGKDVLLDSYHFYWSSHNDDGYVHRCKECYGIDLDTQLPVYELPMKLCRKCNRELPCTDYYFYRYHSNRGGRCHVCKECMGYVFKDSNSKGVPDGKRGYKICNKCKRELKASPVFFDVVRSNKDGYHGTCRMCRGYKSSMRRKMGYVAKGGFKRCYDCREVKAVSEFTKNARKKDGLHHVCKSCGHHRYASRYVKRSAKNSSKYYKKNKDKQRESRRVYQAKKRKDPTYRMILNLRTRMRNVIIYDRGSESCLSLLGADRGFVIDYIEGMFKKGMSWENYGVHGWHVDHIKPCALFDFAKEEDAKECFHYTNLQPMWAKDNIRKGKKYYQ